METIIGLKLEDYGDCVLVSSPQFPLFHLSISSREDAELERCVLPMLKELIERQKKITVDLRLVPEFPSEHFVIDMPTHVIAHMQAQ